MKNVLVITLKSGKVLYDTYDTEESATQALAEMNHTLAYKINQSSILMTSGKVSFARDQYAHAELREEG